MKNLSKSFWQQSGLGLSHRYIGINANNNDFWFDEPEVKVPTLDGLEDQVLLSEKEFNELFEKMKRMEKERQL